VPLRLPYTTLDDKSDYLRLLRRIVQTADHIVTVSETSRRDIIRLLDCPEDKVTNTYQSVAIPRNLLDKPEEQVASEIEGALGVTYKGYLLFYGAIEPKKNVGRLIEAYLTSGVEIPLVLIGPLAWQWEQELRLLESTRRSSISAGGPAARIRHFDYAPFSLLVSAIRGARATVFPSLYEGFGLPVLESMILGTPVVTSREGATAEIAGDAALLIDPYDVRDIANAIRAVADDTHLIESLSKDGLTQAASYSSDRHKLQIELLHRTDRR
jgi:glycosyltransferase involved in cell wall biosynthesis